MGINIYFSPNINYVANLCTVAISVYLLAYV